LKGNIFINKQKNINYVVLNKNIKNVIGFNSGLQHYVILISNPNINIT